MTELVRLILDAFRWFNPFVMIHTGVSGIRFRFGRAVRVVGPGLHWATPGISEIAKVSLAQFPALTRRHDVTLIDGKILSFSATATFQVSDPVRAYCRLDDYKHSVEEVIARVLSDELAEVEPEKFDPARGKRRNLVERLRKALDVACEPYGVQVVNLGLTDFVIGVRTVRLLVDRAGQEPGRPPHLPA